MATTPWIPIAVDGLGLAEDERYTVIVAGDATEANAPQVILLGDSGIATPPSGSINLRLVHGAATFGDVDVFLVPADSSAPPTDAEDSAPLINDLTFGADFPGSAFGNPGAFTDLPNSQATPSTFSSRSRMIARRKSAASRSTRQEALV